jgi:hypothetical protein
MNMEPLPGWIVGIQDGIPWPDNVIETWAPARDYRIVGR